MSKVYLRWAVLGVGLFASNVAGAGSVSNTVVTMGTVNGLPSAKGVLRAVRNSADSTSYIGCSIYAYDSGSYSITCYANAANGAYLSCFSSDPQMINVALSLNPASYLYFVANPDGSCNRVVSNNVSYNL